MAVPLTLSSVPAQVAYAQYVATSGQTVFPYPFEITQDSDLVCLVNSVELDTDVGYSLSGQGDNTGGFLTFNTGQVAGTVVTVYRDITIARVTQLATNGTFFASNFNNEFNRIYLILQQLQAANGFALQVPNTNNPTPVTLLTPTNYANKYLAFDANGNPTAAVLTSTTLTQAVFNSFYTTSPGYFGTNDQDALDAVCASLQAGTGVTLATFGDSTMWGANVANLATQVPVPPYEVLQGTVNTLNANNACTVTNYSISGTTLAQMLAGTDGSGLTFAARVAASPALVVYCNHGVNDAFGPNATSAAVYRANLITFIQIVRSAGKTPVLVTPHSCHNYGALGSYGRTAATAQFARIMRQVAAQHGVFVVDTFNVLEQIIDTDANDANGLNTYWPGNILPDGVHGGQGTYDITGVQLAEAIIGAQVPTITGPEQILTAARALWQASNSAYTASTTSRYGAYATSGSSGAGLAVAFRVAKPGMDISLLHPISSVGCSNISITLDGGGNIGGVQYSQNIAGWSTNKVQDFETSIIRNITPGLHLLFLSAQSSATGTIAFNGLKSRQFKKPLQVLGGSSTSEQGYFRELLRPSMELRTGSETNVCVIDEVAVIDPLAAAVYIEFTATLPINCGMCVGGYYGPDNGSPTAQQMIGVGLNGSGYITVTEATGPGTYNTTVLGSTDLHAGSHVYQFLLPGTNTIQVFVDGASAGSVTLAGCYFGGWLGIYKALAATDLVVTNINRIWVKVD